MFSLDSFYRTYDADSKEAVIRGRRFEILVPACLERFIDDQEVFHDFPLWAKIWEASWVLADHLAAMRVESGKRFLEIGSGIGFVSIVATTFGHDVTMTEHNAHSLEFARANAELNLCPNMKILDLDWNNPHLMGRFDYIVGSEITYQEKSFESLRKLMESLLKPGGTVILASEVRATSLRFFRQMQAHFHVRARQKVLRSDDRAIRVILCTMTQVP